MRKLHEKSGEPLRVSIQEAHLPIGSLAFIPGEIPPIPGPLARFLPPIPDGVAGAWLATRLPASPDKPWVMDPFGASPRLAVEAARAGYRVLVAANNPVSRFLLEMFAHPPSQSELQASLAELAAAHKGSDRIEPHIRSLYTTTCTLCGQPVEVEAYLWERGSSLPYGSLYDCTNCGASGEHPATHGDLEHARQFASGGLHRARALERVAPANDPDRAHVEEALSVYLPRTVYALFTLINKLDGLAVSQARRSHLSALLLSACDRTNALWAYPTERERPRQLTIPPRFRENNPWLALEGSISRWSSAAPPIPITLWPQLPPPEGGICLFEGRLKDLGEQLRSARPSRVRIGAVLAALPRPNQAYWTLSALWAGWLWGREAVGPFKTVLRRRRYDWAWHTTALQAALESLAMLLSPGTPFIGLTGEAEAGLLTAVLVAASSSGFDLRGLALRAGSDQAQIYWERAAGMPQARLYQRELEQQAIRSASQSALQFLQEFGQPTSYLPVHTAGLIGLVEANIFPSAIPHPAAPTAPGEAGSPRQVVEESPANEAVMEASPAENFNLAHSILHEALTYRGGFLRFGAAESFESGLWWLRQDRDSQPPFADRLEKELVNHLIRHPGCSTGQLDNALCYAFPGLLTPDLEWIHVCLDSYAIQESLESGRWWLRPEDEPAARRADLEGMQNMLQTLAGRLGYTAEGEFPLLWLDEIGGPRYWFYPIASAVVGEIMLGRQQEAGSPASLSVIVLPGGRANLVAYKLRRDPRLKRLSSQTEEAPPDQPTQSGWRFVKSRQLRWMVDNPLLRRENLDELMSLDPLTFAAPQMRLL